MEKHICVAGIGDFNREMLASFEQSSKYDYHPVLNVSIIQGKEKYDMVELMERAQSRIDAMPQKPDAIVGFWNFPVPWLVSLLTKKNDLPGLPYKALVLCEHKYISRKVQAEVIPEHTPEFNLVNPLSENPREDIELEFPFWLKPVISFASQLGFKINDKEQFDESIEIIRKHIHRFAEPANQIFKQEGLPESFRNIDGFFCIAEQIVTGRQCTLEGYVHNNMTVFTGTFDSLRHRERETFYSYEYPSYLDGKVIRRMEKITERLIHRIGYNDSSFNIEFFYDEGADHIWLLEINPRISQSHSDLFYKVDGAPNHKTMLEVALGKNATFPHRQGKFRVAGKFYYRSFEDGMVTRIPSGRDLQRFKNEVPDLRIMSWVERGTRLSELYDQDSYSYKLASVYLGANSREELHEKRDHVFYNMLNYEIEPVSKGTVT